MGKNAKNGLDVCESDERTSMNTLGDLHGRVDFFGIETNRVNKPIYQKLKVIQTWVFIQALAITLLIAYLILLTVWLTPFFPMNYDTDEEADVNTAAIVSLQTNQTTTQDQADKNEAAIAELQEWRRSQAREIKQLSSAVTKLQSQVANLYNETAALNDSVVQLQQEVNELSRTNDVQAERMKSLDIRVTALEVTVGNVAATPTSFPDDVRTKALTETLLKRVAKLEYFKEGTKGLIEKLQDDVDERFCNVTKTIGDVNGKCVDLQRRSTALEQKVGNQADDFDKLTSSVNHLRTDVNELNETVSREHDAFETDIAGIRTEFTRKDYRLRNKTKVIAEKLAETIDRQVNESRETRERFLEQNELRDLAAEKKHVKLEEAVAKLRCEIGALNSSVQANLETCKNTIMNKTQDAIEQAQEMVGEAEEKLQVFVDRTKEDITHEITQLNQTVIGKLGMVKLKVIEETQARKMQYTRLCERVDGIEQETREQFTALVGDIEETNEGIQNLSNAINNTQQEEIEQGERISSLSQQVEKHNLDFVEFKAKTVATEIHLRNETRSLRDEVKALENGHNVLVIRLTNSENRTNFVEFNLTWALLEIEAKFLRGLAELGAGDKDIIAKTEYLNETLQQLIRSFGGEQHIKDVVDKISQLLPQVSTPRPVPTFEPDFAGGRFTTELRDSIVESTPEDYDEDYYKEHE